MGIPGQLRCSENRADLVEDGIDCAVWSGDIQDTSLVARGIGQLYLATCAAPSYLGDCAPVLHPKDLALHKCISHLSPRTGRTGHWVFDKDGEHVSVPLKGHISLNDENSYLASAEAGLGIARIPAFVVYDAMKRATLDLVLAEWLPEPVPLHVVYPQRRHLSGKIRVFIDWIAELFREHDGIQMRSSLKRG
jgi:LysR family transcriptional regulator for bpeEF and oprC